MGMKVDNGWIYALRIVLDGKDDDCMNTVVFALRMRRPPGSSLTGRLHLTRALRKFSQHRERLGTVFRPAR